MKLQQLHRKPKRVYLFAALSLFAIEVLIERFAYDDFIRPYLGDFLVVILIYSIVMLLSNLKVLKAAIATLIFSYIIETAQYFQVVSVLGLEEYKWARIIIGTSFSWWDILMYSLGILSVLILERCSSKKSEVKE